MKNVKLFYLFSVLLLFTACDKGDNNTLNFNTEIITFKADSTSLVNPSYTQLVETDSNEFLVTYNGFTRFFEFRNLPTGNIWHKFHLDREGENGVNKFRGGTLTNGDSIWFIYNPPTLGLTDLEGNVLLRKEIIDDRTPLQVLRAYPDKRLFQYKNKIFGSQSMFMDHHGMDKGDIGKYRLVYSYDIKTELVEWYDVYYSSEYWDNGKKLTDLSWARRNDKLYIAPWYDHEIQIFDMNIRKVIDKKIVKSSYVDKFLYVNEIPYGSQNGILAYLKHDQYNSLLYDQYRDVFYRLFFPTIEIDQIGEDLNYRDLMISRPYLGVMVLDSELNVIGEHVFDKFQIYTLRNHFVGKKGLYLSMNNLFDPDYDEEMFRYLIFTPESGPIDDALYE